MNIRNIALDNVMSILEDKDPLHTVLASSLKGIEDARDKSFVSKLVRGTVERAYSLDRIIDGISTVKVKKQKAVIRNILRTAVYQILFMDSVTDFAACDESVKLAGKRGFKSLSGFVNGVLRNICRKKEEILLRFEDDKRENLSFKYSLPDWITEMLVKAYGKEAARRALEYFLDENRIPIRTNTLKISPEGLKERLGPYLDANPYLKDSFYINIPGSLEELKEFKEGLFTVQDMSSVLVGYCAEGLKLKKGARALDLCAAPGGKSMHLSGLGFEVVSCDISQQKLDRISENRERLGADKVSLRLNDAVVFNTEFEEAFDLVLCDLPCSGLGIIGKKPDIKYNTSFEKINELSKLQKSMLINAVRYIKPDGYLIYSTCTLTGQENKENAAFIEEELKLEGVRVKNLLPEAVGQNSGDLPYIQILPGEFGSDGFFISCFRKGGV